MNFSGYFLLAAAAFSVVLVKNSDASVIEAVANYFSNANKELSNTIRIIEQTSKENEDGLIYPAATQLLKMAYINATYAAAQTEKMMYAGIEAAKVLVHDNPENAKKAIQQASKNAWNFILASGVPIFGSHGAALSLSAPGAREGLEASNILIQNSGFMVLDIFDVIEYLISHGIGAGGDAGEMLLESTKLAVKSAYAGVYVNVQDSIQIAIEALRNAHKNPFQGQVRQYCQVNTDDSDAKKAINELILASSSAMKRGGNGELVQKLTQVLICAIGDFVQIAAEGKKTVDNIRSMNGIEPLAVKITYFKQAESIKKAMSEVTAKIYLILGEIALRAGKLSNEAVGLAFVALERGQVEVFTGINAAGEFIALGQENKGNSPKLAIEAASKAGLFAKKAFIQEVVASSKLLFDVL